MGIGFAEDRRADVRTGTADCRSAEVKWTGLEALVTVQTQAHHLTHGKGREEVAIITISRGSYSKGREIAEKLAEALGYDCVSREVLIGASGRFNVPEIKLVRALHDAPKVLDRFSNGKKKYVAYIKQAFLEHVQIDNVVYHGLAGHFFLRGVGHALKVRIIADLNDRVRLEKGTREDHRAKGPTYSQKGRLRAAQVGAGAVRHRHGGRQPV